jgi:hypothetical protein
MGISLETVVAKSPLVYSICSWGKFLHNEAGWVITGRKNSLSGDCEAVRRPFHAAGRV